MSGDKGSGEGAAVEKFSFAGKLSSCANPKSQTGETACFKQNENQSIEALSFKGIGMPV